jgi:predicted DCC family thiol-disulfide oxidoreductase YuxK
MKVTIVYDRECPVCRRLVTATRLKERGAELELINARRDALDDIQGADLTTLDFDEGFAVVVDGHVHHGAEGARVLALLTEPTGVMFRLFRFLVRTPGRSRVWYPVFRAGRNLLLRLLRIPTIGSGTQH